MSLDDLLENNRRWSEEQVAREPEFFQKTKHGQNPRLLWIGCSDSRVPAEQILGAKPGDLFVHRNIANVIAYNDVNIASVVQYAVEHLKVQDIVICGHYGCGGVRAACEEEIISGYIGDWLAITSWAKRWVDDRLATRGDDALDREDYLRMVVEENVLLQMRHLSVLSMVRDQWRRTPGSPRLHAWVYDIGSGRIKVLGSQSSTVPAKDDMR